MKKTIVKISGMALCVLVLLVATLFCCDFAMRAQDTKMLKTVYPREKASGTLATQAEDIPVIRAIFELNQFYDEQTLFHETGAEPQMLSHAAKGAANAAVKGLIAANVFPKTMQKTLENTTLANTAKQGEYGMLRKTETDFSLLYGGSYTIQRYRENLVTRASFQTKEKIAEKLDVEAAVDAYIAYLGMDGLPDWKPADIAGFTGQIAAARYARSAQLYVMVSVDTRGTMGDTVTLGAYYKAG